MRGIGYTFLCYCGLCLHASGCGQELVIPCPECQEGGVCDDDGGTDGCSENATSISVDEALPCLVFQSARVNGEDTIIDVAELGVQVADGELDFGAMVFVIGALECQGCKDLNEAISAQKQSFDDAKAYMIGVVRTQLGDTSVEVSLGEAEYILVNEESWPSDWPITNDPENALGSPEMMEKDNAPWVLLVRISDMKVISFDYQKYNAANVDKLISDIANIESAKQD